MFLIAWQSGSKSVKPVLSPFVQYYSPLMKTLGISSFHLLKPFFNISEFLYKHEFIHSLILKKIHKEKRAVKCESVIVKLLVAIIL